jgi:hypothetical protein
VEADADGNVSNKSFIMRENGERNISQWTTAAEFV